MTNPTNISAIRQRLEDRAAAVRADIQRELLKYDDDRYSMLADRVADLGDQSLQDLLLDVDLAEISRDVEEFREIDAALMRLNGGSYGICIDCEGEVEPARLEANPSASRCLNCQAGFESQDRKEHHRTL